MTLNLAPTPLVAILRGVTPDEADSIAAVLVEAGFGAIEVPLNSPDPFVSIEIIARLFGDQVLVGAGTVLEAHDVDKVAEAGARLVVAPNADHAVIERAVKLDLLAVPGVATPTEAFAALKAGASGLKLFPGESHSAPRRSRRGGPSCRRRRSSIRSAESRPSASALTGAPARAASGSARLCTSRARASRRSRAPRRRS